jgi:hypothetical protein
MYSQRSASIWAKTRNVSNMLVQVVMWESLTSTNLVEYGNQDSWILPLENNLEYKIIKVEINSGKVFKMLCVKNLED